MAKKRDWQEELATQYSEGVKELLMGRLDPQQFRQKLATWWKSLTVAEQIEYKEELREQLINIKRIAEAVTMELYQASVRP